MELRGWIVVCLGLTATVSEAFLSRGPHPGFASRTPRGFGLPSAQALQPTQGLTGSQGLQGLLQGQTGARARGGRQADSLEDLAPPIDQPSQRLSAPAPPQPQLPPPPPPPPPPPEQPVLPTFWQRCVITQPDFDLCLRDAIQSTLPLLIHGVPELALPPLEPAELPGELVIPARASRVHLSLALARIRAHGVTRAHVLSVFSDLKHGLLDIHAFVPWMLIEADFKAQGQVLDQPVDAHGRVNISLHGVELFFGYQSALEERGRSTHMSVKSARVDLLSLRGMHARFEPMDPDPRRSEELNSLLDSQSKALWSVMRERLQDSLAAAFQHVAALLFDQVPMDEIFLSEQHPAVRRWHDALLRAPVPAHAPHALLRAPPPWLFADFQK